jgi:putative ABC transport system permease protein
MRGTVPGSRSRALLIESLRSVLRHPLASSSLLVIAALTSAAVLLTVGNSIATESAVIGSLDDAGSRIVVAYDPDGSAAIDASTMDVLARGDAAAWSIGLGAAVDHEVDEQVGRVPVAVRPVFGDLRTVLQITEGRMPRAGEAIIGTRAATTAGLLDGVGGLTSGPDDVPVVGVFKADGPLDQLNDVALQVDPGARSGTTLRYIYSLAPSISQVGTLAKALQASVVAAAPEQVRIDEPKAAVDLQRAISGELGASSRRSMLLILAMSGALVLTVVSMVVGSRRRDVGRLRALGASRSAVVVHFLIQVMAPVATGAAAGALGAQGWNSVTHGFVNSWAFAGALVVDAVLVATAAGAIPCVAAAQRDPVRILRVP